MDDRTVSQPKPPKRVRLSGSRLCASDLRILKDMENGMVLKRIDHHPLPPEFRLSGERDGVFGWNTIDGDVVGRLCRMGVLSATIPKNLKEDVIYSVSPRGRRVIRNKGIVRSQVELPDLFLDAP